MLRLSSARTALRSSVIAPCSLCQQQRRSAHKLVEVELIQDVLGVGSVGDRLPLSPGFVRNRLLPLGQALLIVKGKVASPMRDMMRREVAEAAARAKLNPRRRLVAELRTVEKKIKAPLVEDPLEAIRAAETLLAESLSLLPPLSFYRRLITPSLPASPPLSTSASAASAFLDSTAPKSITGSAIFGSVGERDVLIAMKEFGVTLDEGLGAFDGEEVEKGRIKSVGTFTFRVTLKHIGQSIPVQVDVQEDK